jgi:hypothetical protein
LDLGRLIRSVCAASLAKTIWSKLAGFRELGIERFYLQRPAELDRAADAELAAAL